jgi:trimeric autotransporter adhesin
MPTTISGSYPAVNSDSDATINGLTVGRGAGAVATNTAVGASALAGNSTGIRVTALGTQALQNNTASENTALGARAMLTNTSGANNTAVGRDSMYFNTTGGENSALGLNSLVSNTTGSNNTAIGRDALQANTTASSNTAVGYQALYSASTSSNNTAFGYQALYSHNGGGGSYLNCAFGYAPAANITGGYVNTCIGPDRTGNTLTTGTYNTLIGTADASAGAAAFELVIASTNPKATGKGSSTAFITANGGGTYNGANTTTWATTSDQRLKKNIVDNTIGLDVITQIKVRNFEYKLSEEVTELESNCAIQKEGVQLGVIAQELQQVLPECVKEESTGVLSVQTDNLIWYLINSIKELNAKVIALEAQLGAK